MPKKRLVVCCDGTWNKAETKTSISRLHDLVEPRGRDGLEQRPKYIEGVGAGKFDRFRGGLFGVGLSDNIKSAYKWLAQNYEPGDEIFCFGFSRGAYTARSLCGLLGASGLLHGDSNVRIDDAFEYYRTKPERREGSKYLERLQGAPRHTLADGLRVKMLGVFDTVGALGVPVPLFASLTQWRRVAFHDTHLSALIEHAYHALAIDEQRGPFRPTLWKDVARDPDGAAVEQTVEQAWFAGVHSDVGGGYLDKRLADVPFAWMLARAEALGLHVDRQRPGLMLDPAPCGKAHDSLSTGYKLAAWWPWIDENGPRAIGNDARRKNERIDAPEALHSSVDERLLNARGELARSQAPYRPVNVVDQAGERLTSLVEMPTAVDAQESADRRRSTRVPQAADGTLDGRRVRLVDLSVEGAGLRLEEPLDDAPPRRGQEVTVEAPPIGRRQARVVWRQGSKLGVAFAEAA